MRVAGCLWHSLSVHVKIPRLIIGRSQQTKLRNENYSAAMQSPCQDLKTDYWTRQTTNKQLQKLFSNANKQVTISRSQDWLLDEANKQNWEIKIIQQCHTKKQTRMDFKFADGQCPYLLTKPILANWTNDDTNVCPSPHICIYTSLNKTSPNIILSWPALYPNWWLWIFGKIEYFIYLSITMTTNTIHWPWLGPLFNLKFKFD